VAGNIGDIRNNKYIEETAIIVNMEEATNEGHMPEGAML